jgi:exopolyphosphatase/guanosine-5'-triphosphate,3'-diphosphate pyrophosphatase
MGERYAAIDVGTNSVLLLVVERDPAGRLVSLDERLEITRLGRGVDRTRRLDSRSIEDTVAALARFAAVAREHGAGEVLVTATSAARDAENGGEFFARAREAAGVEVEVLSGDLEAELSYEAAARDFGGPGVPLAMVDIGGGSTEIVQGEGDRLSFRKSLDVGAVRLTERWLASDPATPEELSRLRDDLRRALAAVPPAPAGMKLVGIAGTITTLCAIDLGIDGYDGRLVHGRELSLATVRELAGRLGPMPLEARKRVPGLPEKRADTIVAGAEILAAVLERLGLDRCTVSDRGVRWGLLYRRFGGGRS